MENNITSNRGKQLFLQLGVVLLAWVFVASLGWRNDGLWFQGDAPRHAANSLFWKEFLLSGSLDPKDFALRYYARYPVISPVNYPPLFYILAGALFAASYPSPYAAKVLVLLFALFAAFYMLAWLRRWIDARTGWAAALLLLTPGFVLWSNAVMLNVPAAALSLAALYHAKRWMETPPGPPARRQLYTAAAFSVAATLTHFIAGILVFMILAWIVCLRQWDKLRDFRTVFAALISGSLLLPFYYVAQKWAPLYTHFVTRSLQKIGPGTDWTFYPKVLPDLAGPVPLALGLLGLAAGVANRRWRRETGLLAVLLLVNYLALSLIIAKDARYGLLFCLPVVCFCAMAVRAAAEWLGKAFMSSDRAASAATGVFAIALCVGQAWPAARTPVPRLEGLKDVVDYTERVAPAEPVFYDGYYHNVFAFYLQAGDPRYQRRVVLGAKLLYASAINPMERYRSFAHSPEDVVRLLQTRGGCRWLVIEQSRQSRKIPAAVLLRQAVQSPQFELIRSFPASGPGLERIDVYRFRMDIEPVDEVDLPFPILGRDTRFNVRPIER
jgi:hypothetical protein